MKMTILLFLNKPSQESTIFYWKTGLASSFTIGGACLTDFNIFFFEQGFLFFKNKVTLRGACLWGDRLFLGKRMLRHLIQLLKHSWFLDVDFRALTGQRTKSYRLLFGSSKRMYRFTLGPNTKCPTKSVIRIAIFKIANSILLSQILKNVFFEHNPWAYV